MKLEESAECHQILFSQGWMGGGGSWHETTTKSLAGYEAMSSMLGERVLCPSLCKYGKRLLENNYGYSESDDKCLV